MDAKRLVVGSTVTIVVVLLGAAAVALVQRATAQETEGSLAHILEEEAGDDKVVVRVDDIELLRGVFRQSSEVRAFSGIGHAPGEKLPTPEEAIRLGIVGMLYSAIMFAEAKRQGYVATEEETRAHMAPYVEGCKGPQGKECQDYASSLGMTMDEFFELAFDAYRRTLSIMKLKAENVVPLDRDWSNEREHDESVYELYRQAKDNAQIEWFAPRLQEIYERQHAIDPRVNSPTAVTPR